MEFGLLIMVAVLWFGLTVRKARLKAMREAESEPEVASAAPKGTVKSAFESLFDSVPEPEEADIKKRSFSFADETSEAGYFSYESPVDDTHEQPIFKSAPKTTTKKSEYGSTHTAQETLPDAQSFDLRQAVIYQTILTNKYISDIHTCDY